MNSFIPWIGGKRLLRNQIVSLFPEKIDRYIEVFGGGGSILFAKDKHATLEVYNDADGRITSYNVCYTKLLRKRIRAGNVICVSIPKHSIQDFLLCTYASHTFESTGHTIKADFKIV